MKSPWLKTQVITMLLITVICLSSCSGTKSAQADYCKQVMQIVGRYADLQMKAITDPEGVIANATETIKELKNMAAEMPSGEQKDYVNELAATYELSLDPNSGIEAAMGLMATLSPTKIQIICPK